ncbi:MAG: ABC transporter permease [Chloroflexota bacterium]|nr:ABC transporter permease [Chloroflexota bacterium]
MGLWQYIARRLVQAVVVLLFVSVAVFALMHAVPGDPLAAVIGERQADRPEVRAALESRYGLDKPVAVQYVYYLKNVVLEGDLGTTISTRQPVAKELGNYIPATIELSIAAMLFALAVGIPLGIISALRPNRWQDMLARFISLIGTAMPVFWLGLLLAYLLTFKLRWLPRAGFKETGMKEPDRVTGFLTIDSVLDGNWTFLQSYLTHMILPAIVLGSFAMGIIARMLRSSLIAALQDDYVRTARAKGLSEGSVVRSHALRNALIPTITVIGLTFSSLLAGAVLTETIFSWPGIGQFAVKMALKLDYPGLLGVTLFVAVAYILVNLAVDVLYGILDPRIRIG